MPILLFVIAIVILIVILKIHNFNKTTYHKSTHNSYFGTIHATSISGKERLQVFI